MHRREFLQSSLGLLSAAAFAPNAWPFAAQPPRTRLVLYLLGRYSQSTPAEMRAVTDRLGNTRFNVLILSFLQTSLSHSKLSLSYNGNPFPLAPEVPVLLRRLRTGYGGRKRVLFSIGGWQHKPTFDAIRDFGVARFVAQLSETVIQPLGLDGIDLDLEPQDGGLDKWFAVHREHGETIVAITNEYKHLHPSHVVTHSPISAVAAKFYAKPEPIPGASSGLLHATRTARGNNVDWLNVQFYEGGQIDRGSIAEFYCGALLSPLMRQKSTLGVEQLMDFLVPLFEPAAKQPLEFCQETIRAIDRRCGCTTSGHISGSGLWDYDQIARDITEWSNGLHSVLQV